MAQHGRVALRDRARASQPACQALVDAEGGALARSPEPPYDVFGVGRNLFGRRAGCAGPGGRGAAPAERSGAG
jgi:hypothetical protein